MASDNTPSTRDRLLLELEDLEAFFCNTQRRDTLVDSLYVAQEAIPTLKMEIPVLKDVVLTPDGRVGGPLNPPAERSAQDQAPLSHSTHLSENVQSLSLDTVILPPINPLPLAKSSNQSTERLSLQSQAFPFLETIASSTECASAKSAYNDSSLEEDLTSLTVDDDEVDEILGDIMTEILPVIERKLRKKLRKKLREMLLTQT